MASGGFFVFKSMGKKEREGAMNTEQAIRTRNSTRSFLDRQVDPGLLRYILELSMLAPSGCNIQPYRIALASGDHWKKISQELVRLADTTPLSHEISWSLDYPERYKKRQRETGFGLYRTLKIAREDREKRRKQFLKNFSAFGAPGVVFVFADREVGGYAILDLGIWMQTFMLAAHAKGLSTVPLTSLAAYPSTIRGHFNVPEYMALACAIAYGYADPDDDVNTYRPGRVPLEEIMLEAREPESNSITSPRARICPSQHNFSGTRDEHPPCCKAPSQSSL